MFTTQESTFMQHSMMKGSNALNRRRLKELNDERAMEGTQPVPQKIRELINKELDRHAHPLPRNAWKLDAVSGLAQRAAEELIRASSRRDQN